MEQFNDMDLHCISRVIQSALFTESDMFNGCKYCKYGVECRNMVKSNGSIHFNEVRIKLQELTGVDLSFDGSKTLEARFLKASFQETYPEEYKKLTSEHVDEQLDN